MMKRLLTVLLGLLLLTGCSTLPRQETTAPTPPTQATRPTTPTVPAPTQNQDALTAYTLPDGAYTTLAVVGDGVAVFGDNALLLTQGGAVTAQLTDRVYAGAKLLSASEAGLCCYDAGSRTVLLLNSSLEVEKRFAMPEQMLGEPIADIDSAAIYYSVGDEVRVTDMNTGLTRLLRTQSGAQLSVERVCCGGTRVLCRIAGADETAAFLSAETGELLESDASLLTYADNAAVRFLTRADGTVTETLFGAHSGALKRFVPRALADLQTTFLPECGSVICVGQDGGSTALDVYDLTAERRVSSLVLDGVSGARGFSAQAGRIWFLLDARDGATLLCCWQLDRSAADDDAPCGAARITADTPDTQALALCAEQARALAERFGIDIRIWTEIENPEDAALEPEYQPEAIRAGLAQLEAALLTYPAEFLAKLCSGTSTGVLHICLVRSISDGSQGTQYYLGGDAWIALAIGADMAAQLHNGVALAMDAYIYSNSLRFDEWNELNPEGFAYDYNDFDFLDRAESPYLTGQTQAFATSRAMSYPREDRASVFEYALRGGQEALFAKPAMQEKLKTVCLAIRDAFGWEKETAQLPWEQYLTEPIAYQAVD